TPRQSELHARAFLRGFPKLCPISGRLIPMMFKLFVFLRLPVSVLALAGLAGAIGSQSSGEFGVFVGECLLAYLVFTTAYLARLLRGALQLAGWLLLLETVG